MQYAEPQVRDIEARFLFRSSKLLKLELGSSLIIAARDSRRASALLVGLPGKSIVFSDQEGKTESASGSSDCSSPVQ